MAWRSWPRRFSSRCLVFSLGVLAIAVGLTFAQILHPVLALLHELSSIPVIASSARLIGRRDKARAA